MRKHLQLSKYPLLPTPTSVNSLYSLIIKVKKSGSGDVNRKSAFIERAHYCLISLPKMQRADTSAFTKAPQLLQMHPLREVFKLKQKQKTKRFWTNWANSGAHPCWFFYLSLGIDRNALNVKKCTTPYLMIINLSFLRSYYWPPKCCAQRLFPASDHISVGRGANFYMELQEFDSHQSLNSGFPFSNCPNCVTPARTFSTLSNSVSEVQTRCSQFLHPPP